jgi:hypothetical protein
VRKCLLARCMRDLISGRERPLCRPDFGLLTDRNWPYPDMALATPMEAAAQPLRIVREGLF